MLSEPAAAQPAAPRAAPRLRRTFGPVDIDNGADMALWALAWGVQPAAIRQAIAAVGAQPLALSNYFAQTGRRAGGAP